MATATVSIAGNGSTVDVTLEDGSTVGSVVTAAIKELGLGNAGANLSLVKNGEDATAADPVAEADVVTAAPQVANG